MDPLREEAGEPLEPERPAAIGPYRVVAELGRGGMGVVYEAERDGRRSALKLMPAAAVASPSSLERFRREARILARLSHPGIVRVRDAGLDRGAPYLVMDLVEGRPLSELDRPLPLREGVAVVRDLARALAAAHAAGVLHRDLKPQNVVLRFDGTPVLLDFGLVRAEDESTLTRSGELIGTPRYMAPEQAEGEQASRASDVYALGLLLYELACGRPARPAESRERVLRRVLRAEVPALRRDGRRLPRPLARVVESALEPRAGRRTASADELADDLERFLRGEPVRARGARPWTRAARAARRHPRGVAAGAVVVVSLAAAVVGARSMSVRAALRGERARALERPLGAWVLGHPDLAADALRAGLRSDPTHAEARALEALLRSEPAPESAVRRLRPELGRAVADLAAGRPAAAAARLAGTRDATAFEAVLAVESLRRTGRGDEALDRARDGLAEHPRSSALAAALAAVLADGGEEVEALAAFDRALELAPDDPALLAARARAALVNGDATAGVRDATRAARLLVGLGHDGALELTRLLAQGGTTEVDDALRELAERTPDDGLVWFAIGYRRDTRHELSGAAAAYARAARLEPRQPRIQLHLAHLHAGAQCGACARCDEAFAREPDVLDPGRALDALRAAVAADRGASEWCLGRVLQTALDLEERAPDTRSLERLAGFLDEALATADLGPVERARLEEGRRRAREMTAR